jgi:cell division protein FtsQ
LNKTKINIIIGRTLLLLLVTGMFVLLVSGVQKKENKACTGLDIQIGLTEKKGFIDDAEVAAIIKDELNRKPTGTPIKNFDLRKTEKALEENVWIKKAQLFFDNNYVLHVQVAQRIPVARLIDNAGSSYYMDSTGFTLPLSMNDRADVPVFTGVPVKRSATLQQNILDISTAINTDSFWLGQAAQINWLPGNKFELYPAFGNHVVDFGDGNGAADKLSRLKLFYKTVSVKKGFDAYPRLSVAFSRQVLAIRPDALTSQVDERKAVQVFDQIVKSNRLTANIEKDDDADKKTGKPVSDALSAEIKPVADHPPDVKNKGNPNEERNSSTTTTTKPKAVMPKLNRN